MQYCLSTSNTLNTEMNISLGKIWLWFQRKVMRSTVDRCTRLPLDLIRMLNQSLQMDLLMVMAMPKFLDFSHPSQEYYPMQYPGFYPGFYPGYNPSVGVYPGYNPFQYPGVPSGFGAAMYPGYSNFMYPKFQPGYGNSPYPGLAGMKPSFGHHLPQDWEMRKIHRGRRQIKN